MLDNFSKIWKVSCNCPNCGAKVEGELDDLPRPDMMAETAWQSADSTNGTLVCSKCNKEIHYSVSVDMNNDMVCAPLGLNITEQ